MSGHTGADQYATSKDWKNNPDYNVEKKTEGGEKAKEEYKIKREERQGVIGGREMQAEGLKKKGMLGPHDSSDLEPPTSGRYEATPTLDADLSKNEKSKPTGMDNRDLGKRDREPGADW